MSRRPREVLVDSACDLGGFGDEEAIVVVDVIRATTTLATALASGRRCFPVGSLARAFTLAGQLDAPLLAGELGGVMPAGFEINNSPAALAERDDAHRPLILLTTSGTRVLASARPTQTVFAASLRNWSAEAERLASGDWRRVAIVGAETRGEFRCEDQLCAAWIAADLFERGFHCASAETERLIEIGSRVGLDTITHGHSAGYLRSSGQLADLEYVLEHVDDLDMTFTLKGMEIAATSGAMADTAA